MHAPVARHLNDSRFLVAVVGGLAFLLSAVVASIVASIASSDVDRWAAHSLMVRQASGHLFSLVQDAETGQRGFLLTGKDSYLEPFYTAQKQIPAAEDTLRNLTSDNPVQQSRLATLYPIVGRKLGELSRTIALAQGGQTEEALGIVKSNEGRNLMGDIRTALDEFDRDEANIENARNATAARLRSVLLVVTIVAGILAALVDPGRLHSAAASRGMRLLTASLKTEMAERERAEAALRQAQKMEALGQLTGGSHTTSTICWRSSSAISTLA